MTNVHPYAVVHPKAQLAEDVTVHPGAVIGPNVTIGSGTVVGAYAVVDGHTLIGKNNQIFPHAVLGMAPQDLKYNAEPTRIEMGDGNLVREFATIHLGTPQSRGVTRIGSHVFLMAYAHVAHDNILEDHVVIANSVQIAGHVVIGEHAIIGGCSAIHQFVRIGAHAFVGGGSVVLMDIPPYCNATGSRARLHGINAIGLSRRGFGESDLRCLRKAYRIAFQKNCLITEAIEKIEQEIVPQCKAALLFSDFLKTSQRGITRR